MASNGLTNLLKRIEEANANISGKLGTLDTHITAIITAGKALLSKIKAGVLLPDQIAQIRGKLNSLREKTLANVGSKNSRIQELEKLFTELLGESPPNTATPDAGNPLGLGNVEDLLSSKPNPPKYTVATGQGYENAKMAKNIRMRMNARALENNAEREKKKGELQELQRLASQQATIGQSPNTSVSSFNTNGTNSPGANNHNQFEALNSAISNPANSNPETVLAKINVIPNSKSASTNNAKIRVQNIVEAIQAVRVFLQQMPTEINDGLLEYIDQRYTVDPRSLIGEMGTKHKPVLKYIVSLAGDFAHFTERIQRPIGIFPKSDIQVRIDILTAVIATLPEENRTELIEYMNSLYRVKQSGGKRKTRCGCGLKGGRRTRKATRRR